MSEDPVKYEPLGDGPSWLAWERAKAGMDPVANMPSATSPVQIRIEALRAAGRVCAYPSFFKSGDPAKDVTDLAERFAAWLETGER